MATSVGGVLTGRGADFIIIDDPLKPDEALSDTQRKAVNDWYDHTLYTLKEKWMAPGSLISYRHDKGRVVRKRFWAIPQNPTTAPSGVFPEIDPA